MSVIIMFVSITVSIQFVNLKNPYYVQINACCYYHDFLFMHT